MSVGRRDGRQLEGRTRFEAATDVIACVRKLGLAPAPGSRLMEAYRVFGRGYIDFADPDFSVSLQAARDVEQLSFVFDHARPYLKRPAFRRLVRKLLKDSVLPQTDRTKSSGRDTQFELYLSAICLAARLLPVEHEEPDVTCSVDGVAYGIAAKRVKSPDPPQIGKHLRKAVDQIRRSRLPGIVAVDLTLSRNRTNQPIASPMVSRFHPFRVHAENHTFFGTHSADLVRWTAGTRVMAVLAFDWVYRVVDREWKSEGTMCWWRPDDGEEPTPEFRRFYEGFLRGVPNLEDRTRED